MTNNECEEECNRDQRSMRNFLIILQIIFFFLRIIPNKSDVYKNWSLVKVFIPSLIGGSIYCIYIIFCCVAVSTNYEPPLNKELHKSLRDANPSVVI